MKLKKWRPQTLAEKNRQLAMDLGLLRPPRRRKASARFPDAAKHAPRCAYFRGAGDCDCGMA